MIADGVIYWFLPDLSLSSLVIFFISLLSSCRKKAHAYMGSCSSSSIWCRHGYLDCRVAIFCWPNRSRHCHYRLHRRYFDDGLDGYPHTNEACYHWCIAIHVLRFSSCNRSIRLRNSIPRCIRYGDVLCGASFHSSQHWKSCSKVFRKPEQSDKIDESVL